MPWIREKKLDLIFKQLNTQNRMLEDILSQLSTRQHNYDRQKKITEQYAAKATALLEEAKAPAPFLNIIKSMIGGS